MPSIIIPNYRNSCPAAISSIINVTNKLQICMFNTSNTDLSRCTVYFEPELNHLIRIGRSKIAVEQHVEICFSIRVNKKET